MPPSAKQDAPENTKEEAAKPKQVKTREWDLGKEGVGGPSLLSQEEWLDRQRVQRVEEFAPPSVYDSNKRHKGRGYPSTSQKESTVNEQHHEHKVDYNQDRRNTEFAPPSTYEYYGPSSFSGRKNYSKPSYRSMEEAIAKGLSSLRNMTDS